MAGNGYIKLHRTLLEWEWYSDIPSCRLFIHLLLKANHAPKKWQGQTINRGQVLTGINSLSEDTGLSPQQIRTAMAKLKSTGEVTSKATNKNTLVTLVKYEVYQDRDSTSNKQTNKRITNEQQTDNKRITTNKNDKKNKNEKKVGETRAKVFSKPTLQELTIQFKTKLAENNLSNDAGQIAKRFIDHYESNGWKVGRNKMTSWQHAIGTWISRMKQEQTQPIEIKSKPLSL